MMASDTSAVNVTALGLLVLVNAVATGVSLTMEDEASRAAQVPERDVDAEVQAAVAAALAAQAPVALPAPVVLSVSTPLALLPAVTVVAATPTSDEHAPDVALAAPAVPTRSRRVVVSGYRAACPDERARTSPVVS